MKSFFHTVTPYETNETNKPYIQPFYRKSQYPKLFTLWILALIKSCQLQSTRLNISATQLNIFWKKPLMSSAKESKNPTLRKSPMLPSTYEHTSSDNAEASMCSTFEATVFTGVAISPIPMSLDASSWAQAAYCQLAALVLDGCSAAAIPSASMM